MTTADPTAATLPGRGVTARALLLGDRIDAAGLERADTVCANPLAFQAGAAGFVELTCFGVAVMVGLSPLDTGARRRPRTRR